MSKIEHANQWLTFATNIGVLAGLVILIIEINQNTTAIENQVDVAIFSDAPVRYVVEHPELAELQVRSESEAWDSFSEVEQEQLMNLWALSLDSAELQYKLRQRSGERLTADNIVFPERLLSRDSFRTFWRTVASRGGSYPPDFIDYFESYMSERGD